MQPHRREPNSILVDDPHQPRPVHYLTRHTSRGGDEVAYPNTTCVATSYRLRFPQRRPRQPTRGEGVRLSPTVTYSSFLV